MYFCHLSHTVCSVLLQQLQRSHVPKPLGHCGQALGTVCDSKLKGRDLKTFIPRLSNLDSRSKNG